MEKKKLIEQASPSEETAPSTESTPTPIADVSQNQQIAELKELTRSLMVSVQAMQAQSARNAVFEDVVADVKAATRAMLVAPVKNAANDPSQGKRDCCGGDSSCGCVSDDCCCFEIVLSKVRGAKPQNELPDIGDVAIPPPPTINAMEVQIYITAGDPAAGFVLPGLASTLDLRTDGILGGPGPWVSIERVVNRVYAKKGTPLSVPVYVEVREHDEGVERPVAFKDEIGEATDWIILDCCMPKIYPPMPIGVNLIHGGEGGGMVEVAYYARRVCC